jgi:hypothetical protein
MNNAALALMISVGHLTKLRYVTNCRAGKQRPHGVANAGRSQRFVARQR